MYFDALILALIQATPFNYRDDCRDVFPDRINTPIAYHRSINWDSHINFCKKEIRYEDIIHEIWHEIHHIIREDSDMDKYVDAFQKLHDMSSTDADYVSLYAQTSVNEDFAETVESYYFWNKNIPEVVQRDWISSGVSNIQRTKFLLIEIILWKL